MCHHNNTCVHNYQSFIYSPTDALVSCLKNSIKICFKIYIKTAPTCFGVTVTPKHVAAEFRLCVGHGCLGTHLHRIAIRPDRYCMLCSLR